MSELLDKYYECYYAFRGLLPAPVRATVNSELSIRYPVLVRKGEGRLVIELTRELSPALEAMGDMQPDSDLDAVMAVLFDEGLKYEPDVSFMEVCRAADVARPKRIEAARIDPRADKRLIAGLNAACSRTDRILAEITVKDDAITGVYDGETLAAAASGIRWGGGIIDIGVLTRPDCRQKGYGEAAVRALCALYSSENPIMQYRTDEANAPSAALMKKLGFKRAFTLTGAKVTL